MRVLVIEDDQQTLDFLAHGLREAGFLVDMANDGMQGLDMASRGSYAALVVDRMLPRLDGLLLIQTLRSMDCTTPALILSALAEVNDRITGLKGGGDDYVAKPFALAEVVARLEALTRRVEHQDAMKTTLVVGPIEMDLLQRTVHRSGIPIPLQGREYRLLEYLMRHAGQVVTRTMLLQGVWDYHFDPQTNVIDVHISRLRQKLDKDFDAPLIHTVRGSGYMLRGDG